MQHTMIASVPCLEHSETRESSSQLLMKHKRQSVEHRPAAIDDWQKTDVMLSKRIGLNFLAPDTYDAKPFTPAAEEALQGSEPA